MEQFANTGTATLNGAILSGATTLVVSSPSNCPSSGIFRIRIDDELLKVSSISGSTWTIARGDGGSTAASHADLTTIYVIVTKEAIDSVISLQGSGTEISTRRVLNFTGATITDDPTNSRANIAISGQSAELAWTSPVDSSFVWLNQGTGTRTVNADGTIFLRAPALSGNNGRGYMIAIPARPYTIILKSIGSSFDVDYNTFGCGFGDNVNSKFHILACYKSNLQVNRMNYTSYNSTDVTATAGLVSAYNWFKLTDNGTNISFSVSVDGRNWMLIWTGSRTAWLTPTHVGMYTEANNGTWDAAQLLVSWAQS